MTAMKFLMGGQPCICVRRNGSTRMGPKRALQLAHNVPDPDSEAVKAQILHSFGRAQHL